MNHIPIADFEQAMSLLGVDTCDPAKVLVTVHIEAGKVLATYSPLGRVSAPWPESVQVGQVVS